MCFSKACRLWKSLSTSIGLIRAICRPAGQVHRGGVRGSSRGLLVGESGSQGRCHLLVDAVILWDNPFGARTETTLRVTSSLAWLLGSSAVDRKSKQKHYKDIYNFEAG